MLDRNVNINPLEKISHSETSSFLKICQTRGSFSVGNTSPQETEACQNVFIGFKDFSTKYNAKQNVFNLEKPFFLCLFTYMCGVCVAGMHVCVCV